MGIAIVVRAAGGEVEDERLLAVLGASDKTHGMVRELLVDTANGVVVDREDRLRFLA